MTEHIERKALLNALKEERKNGNFVFTSKWIKEIMDGLPTADVVPKSEVAEIKKAVAKEIFEELLKRIADEDNLFETCASRLVSSDYANGRSEVMGTVLHFIGELKKKYTEEQK